MVHKLLWAFRELKYRFQRTSTWQKTRITKQLSIMKTPPRLIVWLRRPMERAIMHQARSTRRPPSSTLVRDTKIRRRLTRNLYNRSNLQARMNLMGAMQSWATMGIRNQEPNNRSFLFPAPQRAV